MEINELIHSVLGEEGLIYSKAPEEIFDGSARIALTRELIEVAEKIKKLVEGGQVISDLEQWSYAIDSNLYDIELIIEYSYFELGGFYSQEQMEEYNRYYRTAADWLQELARFLTEPKEGPIGREAIPAAPSTSD
jgi:hypothetical protein